jgi:hypothetical protein
MLIREQGLGTAAPNQHKPSCSAGARTFAESLSLNAKWRRDHLSRNDAALLGLGRPIRLRPEASSGRTLLADSECLRFRVSRFTAHPRVVIANGSIAAQTGRPLESEGPNMATETNPPAVPGEGPDHARERLEEFRRQRQPPPATPPAPAEPPAPTSPPARSANPCDD